MGRSIELFTVGMALMLIVSGSSGSGPSPADQSPAGCMAVQEKMLACSDYLTGNRSDVPASCCEHVQNLNDLVEMCLSPRSICYCVEDLAKKLSSPFQTNRVHALSRKCRKRVAFPISNHMDCSKVQKRSKNC